MLKGYIKIIFFLFSISFLFFKAPLIKGVGGFHFCQASSDIIFNEICWMGDEDSSNNEWIELKNNTDEDLDLVDWTIKSQDGSPMIDLEGMIPARGIFLLERTDDDSSPALADIIYTGALGNDGEILQLKNVNGNIIDEINSEEGWPAGDNTTKQTMEFNGVSWQTSLDVGGTPGEENSNKSAEEDLGEDDDKENNYVYDDISVPDQLIEENNDKKDYEMIVISEIFPDPQGDDRQREFVELKNIGDRSVSLRGWSLQESDGQEYVIKEAVWLRPDREFVIYREKSGLILDNQGDKVLLFSPDRKTAVDQVSYGDYNMAWSYALTAQRDWIWTKQPTPGSDNIIIKKNLPPEIVYNIPEEIIAGETAWFEASDSVDPENDELEFVWDFGDGVKVNLASPSHVYLSSGEYIVTLTITDGINTVIQEEKIIVSSKLGKKISKDMSRHMSRVVINEALPSPSGRDSDEEFIEIKNIGENEVDIYGWSLDDEEGGSSPYVFDSHLRLSPGLIVLFSRPETGIALNNDGDEVRLLDSQGNIIFQTKYSSAPEGQSWARGENDNFFWTPEPTPGMENEIQVADNEFYDVPTSENQGADILVAEENFRQSSLMEMDNFSAGDKVKILGTVAVEPGVLASQYFYITGSPGLQIYNYYKDFPELSLGDMVEVSGEISEINDEKRLKIKTAEDIVVLYHDEAPQPSQILAEEFNDIKYGELVLVSGQVVKKQGSHIYLEDGTGEIDIYIKSSTGIGASFIKDGDNLSVIGLVSSSNSGKIIMPRYSDDIKKINESGAIENNSSPLVGINVVEAKSDWVLPSRNAKKELLDHILILLLGALITLSIWKWRKTKS